MVTSQRVNSADFTPISKAITNSRALSAFANEEGLNVLPFTRYVLKAPVSDLSS